MSRPAFILLILSALVAPALTAQERGNPDDRWQISLADGTYLWDVRLVKLAGDTLFLTETSAGWRITAAVCRPQAERPYECEVDGP